jgi:hypothetical protein
MSKNTEKLKDLEAKRNRLGIAIADKIAERDVVEDLIAAKKKRDPQTDERIAKLEKDIRVLQSKRRYLNKRIPELRGRRAELTEQIKRLIRKIRNRFRPKIIDLNLTFGSMATQGRIYRVIGHYTAGPRDHNDAEAKDLNRRYHAAHRAQGWAGEGYGLNFTSDGSIILLRPLGKVGAHTLGYNTNSLGIMMHGTTGDRATKQQKRALRWWAKNGHTSKMPASHRSPVKPGSVPWYGHNDFGATGCPGSFKPTYLSKGKK